MGHNEDCSSLKMSLLNSCIFCIIHSLILLMKYNILLAGSASILRQKLYVKWSSNCSCKAKYQTVLLLGQTRNNVNWFHFAIIKMSLIEPSYLQHVFLENVLKLFTLKVFSHQITLHVLTNMVLISCLKLLMETAVLLFL
jgi:hypothetical protein